MGLYYLSAIWGQFSVCSSIHFRLNGSCHFQCSWCHFLINGKHGLILGRFQIYLLLSFCSPSSVISLTTYLLVYVIAQFVARIKARD
jgi:hypothetical protein